jgi:hypothetical protein
MSLRKAPTKAARVLTVEGGSAKTLPKILRGSKIREENTKIMAMLGQLWPEHWAVQK